MRCIEARIPSPSPKPLLFYYSAPFANVTSCGISERKVEGGGGNFDCENFMKLADLLVGGCTA